ncbi:GNAT family N-acetyltransferase [Pseudalkalibacillus hwajinpoensis]|uniref:GNAT family N-acetyltransferase n=1 Tax=Guptibacillus hwajinpoensis TaxID=208199 RepID=UPI00325A4990
MNHESDRFERVLTHHGMKHFDTYSGLAKILDYEYEPVSAYTFREVSTVEDVMAHVQVATEIWNYNETARKAAFQERMNYIKFSDRRGGYMIALDGDKSIGYSNYRYSADGRVLYLNGAGVLPTYQGKGIYRGMVAKRLVEAKKRGCKVAVMQARKGTSEPIVKKLGFSEYAVFKQYIYDKGEEKFGLTE